MSQTTFEEFHQLMRKKADIAYAIATLHWDQECNLAEKAAEFRGQQIATLSGMHHELSVSEQLGELIEKLDNDSTLDERKRRIIAEAKRDYEKAKKYTTEFVVRLSKTTSEAFHAWLKARQENDFQIYKPLLARMIELKREEAVMLGYEQHPYDALLDSFEPGMTTQRVVEVFEGIKSPLKTLLDSILSQPAPDDSFLYEYYEKDRQWDFGITLLKQMGYDFKAGRQDLSAHPFTVTLSPKDVRVTTRINERDFRVMTWSCIHEGGHALYEQGLPAEDYGLPSCEACSLGIHESQSRLWENNVGRSLPYWKYNYPGLQDLFIENLAEVHLDDFYRAINRVQPSLIRVEADELTYHFHILIRFELEKALIEGSLTVDDIEEAWNKKYEEYLGLKVPSPQKGILQDIHWSHGSIGYFPTYSLGSFYAAQFFDKACKEIPGLDESIEKGELLPLLHWLREKIHQHGRLYKAHELCERVTGEPLNPDYFIRYATDKFSEIYKL